MAEYRRPKTGKAQGQGGGVARAIIFAPASEAEDVLTAAVGPIEQGSFKIIEMTEVADWAEERAAIQAEGGTTAPDSPSEPQSVDIPANVVLLPVNTPSAPQRPPDSLPRAAGAYEPNIPGGGP